MNLLTDFAARAAQYINDSKDSAVYPPPEAIRNLERLGGPLQDDPLDAASVFELLDAVGSPATVRSSGGRYFGFVTGGALPGALAAKLLATVWDQNAALAVMSPVASTLEQVSTRWLLDVLGLPDNTVVGFVTGATMANFTALASARHALLAGLGWDVESKGLFGAPEITVITGDEVHVSLLKALSMLGFGRDRIIRVPVDGQGRMIASQIPAITGPTLVCAQAGNVNTGAFDPLEDICNAVRGGNVWVHVDGAFGLWAVASPEKKHLAAGIGLADSWATDAHKWLNVPYDNGLVFVSHREAIFSAMSATASYLPEISNREPMHYVPEMSRSARGVVIWAALKTLGKKGLAELIENNCREARRFADGLRNAGFNVLNDVALNQVLVSFGDDATTERVVHEIQQEGTCWMGVTTWQGKKAMRISVSSWATTGDDIDRSLAAIKRVAGASKKATVAG